MTERTLILLRHAKSDWSGDQADLARPLAKRGRRQAPDAGRWLAANIDGIVTAGAGIEVPTFAHAPLADALARITALSDDERRRMGAVGRAYIADNFSTTRVLSEMVDLYDRLLAETPPSPSPSPSPSPLA